MRARLPYLAAALIAAALVVPASYAALRAYDVLRGVEPNPAAVGASLHVAMFWRLAIGGYLAGMAAPLAYLAARRDLARTMRALHVLVLVAGAMLVVQGLALP